VTYIVQRLASLVALGYFVSLAAYVQARLSPPGPRRALWAGLCVASMLLAFVAKENSATLPAALFLTEAALFAPDRRGLLRAAGGALAAMAGYWLLVSLAHAWAPWSPGPVNPLSRRTPELAPR